MLNITKHHRLDDCVIDDDNQRRLVQHLLAFNNVSNDDDRQRLFDVICGGDLWPLSVRIAMTLIFATLSFVGTVGNLLVVVTVLRVRGMVRFNCNKYVCICIWQITPTNLYLVSLAVSDCLFFIATAPIELSYLHLPQDRYMFGAIGCAIFSYLPYLAINASSLSITAFTVERYIGICYPMRAR